MTASDWIQVGLGILTFLAVIISILAFRRDNKNDLEENITNAIQSKVEDVKKVMELETRVKLLEQRVDLSNGETKRDLLEIKNLINQLFKRFNDHLELHNKKGV